MTVCRARLTFSCFAVMFGGGRSYRNGPSPRESAHTTEGTLPSGGNARKEEKETQIAMRRETLYTFHLFLYYVPSTRMLLFFFFLFHVPLNLRSFFLFLMLCTCMVSIYISKYLSGEKTLNSYYVCRLRALSYDI